MGFRDLRSGSLVVRYIHRNMQLGPLPPLSFSISSRPESYHRIGFRNASTAMVTDDLALQEEVTKFNLIPASSHDVTVAATTLGENVRPSVVGHLFSDAAPVLAAGEILNQIHGLPGMDWSKTILLTTLGIRLVVGFPLAVFQQKSIAKLENLQPEMKQLAADLGRETAIATKLYNWDEKKARTTYKISFTRHWRQMVEENNCHPYRTLCLAALQFPFWIGFSCALRNLVFVLPEPRTPGMVITWMQMACESPLWIDSLVTADHFILPGIFLVANLLNLQLNSLRKLTVPQTKLQKAIPWVFRGAIVGITVFAAFTPAAVTLYWATSSVVVLIQNGLMRTRPVRRFLRIPSTPTKPH